MPKSPTPIKVPDFKLTQLTLYVVGTAPLIVHAFPAKARKEMLDKQTKQGKQAKEAREPLEEVEAARYRLPDGRDGVQAIAFKTAAVTACTSLSDVTKVAARQAFRVPGLVMNAPGVLEDSFQRVALIPIVSDGYRIREDVVRLSGVGRTAEVRYRPEFYPWGAEIEVVFSPSVLSTSQIITMFMAAGHGVGIGDYRPERNGDCGTFDVLTHPDDFQARLTEQGMEKTWTRK